jgi:Sap, sulfolipid-1-addressing protein
MLMFAADPAPTLTTGLSLLPLAGELAGFGLAIGFSPLHIGLLLLLLLGLHPLRRGGWLVLGWLVTSAVTITLLLSVGHGLLLSMEKGTSHRTGLDLVAAGGLLALGLNSLLQRREEGDAQPPWAQRLDRFCALPLPLLLGLSSVVQVASPDDLFLYAKAASGVLAAQLNRQQEVIVVTGFSLISGLLLLVPLMALGALGQERVQPWLVQGKTLLLRHGEILMGAVSLGLAVYLGWQGIEGLVLS